MCVCAVVANKKKIEWRVRELGIRAQTHTYTQSKTKYLYRIKKKNTKTHARTCDDNDGTRTAHSSEHILMRVRVYMCALKKERKFTNQNDESN